MAIYELDGVRPTLGANVWVADSAQVMGAVHLGDQSSVWFGAVIRGDAATITIGQGCNIQDACVLHIDADKPLTLGHYVTVGHQAMLHGCTVADNCLIGMGAVILNNARIGKNSLVGARSLVTEGKSFPDGVLILGSPAKVVRELTSNEIANIQKTAEHYMRNAERFKKGLKKYA